MGDVTEAGAGTESNTATEVDLAQPDTARLLCTISSHGRMGTKPSIASVNTMQHG
jgi:hypothetical protein